jgi:hypothetical protein
MPAAFQQQQAEFNVAQVEAQLQAVGEALSLAAATAQAGKALAAGEMSQARHEKLTGQLGDEGDTETETIQSPESEQAAQRAYREKYLEYQKLSEAVLDSEPIPLGHRQTIRRYFQAIRPEQETPPPSRP